MQQLSQELEQEEARSFRHHVGSPLANSPPGKYPRCSSIYVYSTTLCSIQSVHSGSVENAFSIISSIMHCHDR